MQSGQVRDDVGTITQTDFGYTGQRDLPSMGLMDLKARMYDPGLGRFMQPDTIVPDPADPQSLNRYAYALNNPVRYTDPSGHAICPYLECDIVVNPDTEEMQLRGNLHNAAEDLVRELGGKNDLEAMTSIIAAGASAYRSFERLLPQLSEIFLGTKKYGPGTLLTAALGDGCAGVGRDPTSCAGNQAYFTDVGFHGDFRDGNNQLFHLWGYIAEASAPGNALGGALGNRTANVGNYVHEVIQSKLNYQGGEGTSWNDYVLSEAGMKIGALITDQSITPAQLADTVWNTVGLQGTGSGGRLKWLLEQNGPLGGQ